MKTTVEEKDGVITVVFEGRMDTKSTPEVEEDLKPLFDSESQEIVIDCSNLEYVASSGLRVFLSIALDTQSKGKHVTIKGINSFVSNLFEMSGFTDLFDFE
ncbi:MAG: STAS domain-containing protein [Prevotella sp.]|jgi:anti-sigma B factor antagonist|nr:STAS domain-containing protein [Prevotella sp.]